MVFVKIAEDSGRLAGPVSVAENSVATFDYGLIDDGSTIAEGKRIVGTDGDDTLEGDTGDDKILGFDGNDIIYGRPGDDVIFGGRGDDIIYGGSGRDTLSYRDAEVGVTVYLADGSASGWGFDVFYSIEIVDGSDYSDYITGGPGNDHIRGFGGNDFILEGLNNGGGDNIFDGGSGNDYMTSYSGNTTFIGGYGDDFMRGGSGVSSYDGGRGFDRVSFFPEIVLNAVIVDLAAGTVFDDGFGNSETITGVESISGTPFADKLYGSGRADTIRGSFEDIIYGRGGDDILYAAGAPKMVNGGAGVDYFGLFDTALVPDTDGDGVADAIYAFEGVYVDLATGLIKQDGFGSSGRIRAVENISGFYFDDVIRGDGNDNALSGYEGSDVLVGRNGNDALYGGDDDDYLDGGNGNDVIDGGAGIDTARYGTSAGSVKISLDIQGKAQDTGAAGIDTLTGIENLSGSNFDDVLRGDNGDNELRGLDGNDRLFGGSGADDLVGGNGNDLLVGGTGIDTLSGGSGADRFRFYENDLGKAANETDIVQGFDHSDGDRIDLSRIDADITAAADQDFTFVGKSGFSGSAGEVRYGREGGNTVVEMDTDGNGSADLFLILIGQHDLVKGDFIL